MIDFGLTILSGVLIAVITGLVFWIAKAIQKDKKVHKTLGSGFNSIIRYMILQIYKEAKENGGIHTDEKLILNDMFTSYQELGGNGFITGIMDKIEDMEVLTETSSWGFFYLSIY